MHVVLFIFMYLCRLVNSPVILSWFFFHKIIDLNLTGGYESSCNYWSHFKNTS